MSGRYKIVPWILCLRKGLASSSIGGLMGFVKEIFDASPSGRWKSDTLMPKSLDLKRCWLKAVCLRMPSIYEPEVLNLHHHLFQNHHHHHSSSPSPMYRSPPSPSPSPPTILFATYIPSTTRFFGNGDYAAICAFLSKLPFKTNKDRGCLQPSPTTNKKHSLLSIRYPWLINDGISYNSGGFLN